ncbi:MAG TPA: CHAT domain-containing protein [Pyrinomonadaceae bacterium]|nr:CHAT domain-containing protein [Pyrinomonadaceae bacterium]
MPTNIFPLLLLIIIRLLSPGAEARALSYASSVSGDRRPPLALRLNVSQDAVTALRPGEQISKEIKGGETHAFSVALASGQYAQVLVMWQGIDLAVAIIKPDGERLREVEAQVNAPGTTSVSIIAGAPGSYRFEVRPSEALKIVGTYEIKLESVRLPTPADESRFAAERALAEAQREKSKETAEGKFKEALQLWRDAADASGEARSLHGLANLYRLAGNLNKAVEHYELALVLYRKLNSQAGEAYTLLGIGDAYRRLASPQKAMEYYQQAVLIFREIKSRKGEASALYSTGFALARMGNLRDALKVYQEALPIMRAENDRLGEGQTLNAMGGAHGALSAYDDALNLYHQAKLIWQELGDQSRLAVTLNNIGVIQDDQGDWQSARDSYTQLLAISTSLLNQDLKTCTTETSEQTKRLCGFAASALDNIGEYYNTLGDPQTALAKFAESLPIRDALKEPGSRGTTRMRICYSNYLLGKPREALEHCEQARQFLGEAKANLWLANTFMFMGMSHTALNEREKALGYYSQALQVHEAIGNPRGLALTRDKMGEVYALGGDAKSAFENYNLALQLWKQIKDPDGETITLYHIARDERARGNLAEAHKLVEEALSIVESLRANVSGHRLRALYFATKLNYYELDIDLKMQLAAESRDARLADAAFAVNESARARSLIEILSEARIGAGEQSDPKLSELIRSKQALQRKLDVKALNQTRLLSGKHTKEEAAALAKEIDGLVTEYSELEERIREQSPRYAKLVDPRPLSLKEIQQLLDDQTLLLEYALGDERSYLWAVTRTGIKSYTLPPRSEIEKKAARVKQLLTSRQPVPGETNEQRRERLLRAEESDAHYWDAAADLSRIILAPVAAQLGAKRLLIVPDGELQYLPFSALPDPAPAVADAAHPRKGESDLRGDAASKEKGFSPLILRHNIVSLPSASTLSVLQRKAEGRPPARKALAVVADPVFEIEDSRLTAARKSLPGSTARGDGAGTGSSPTGSIMRDQSLPFSRLLLSLREGNNIISQAPPGQGLLATSFDANRALVKEAGLSEYRILHFATHGLLDDQHPELSGIVLSLFDRSGQPQNGFLRLYDIYDLKLSADLVVLSACNTGLGKRINGEGLIGLTRGFMYAGVPRVVASMWQIDDDATAELMSHFYQGMLKKHMTPAEALRDAQIAMWRRQSYRRAPYYWAAFVLQGKW